MKKTAVEWLAEKLRIEFGFAFSNNILEEAKEMEKEQIIDAYIEAGYMIPKDLEDAQEYYNKKFKK